jgi:hypothetical protein
MADAFHDACAEHIPSAEKWLISPSGQEEPGNAGQQRAVLDAAAAQPGGGNRRSRWSRRRDGESLLV